MNELEADIARAAAHLQAGRHADARDVLQSAIDRSGGQAGLWWRLSLVESALGRPEEAMACLGRATQAGSQDAEDWFRIGWLYLEVWRYEEAGRAFEEAVRLAPAHADALRMLAMVRQQSAQDAEVLALLGRARRAAPHDLSAALDEALFLPQVPESSEAIAAWRARFAQGLAALHAALPEWRREARSVFGLQHDNFLLAYHGEDDRELQRGYSRFLAALVEAARPEWRAPRRLRWDGRRRLRVGFVGGLFRDCTAGRYFERWITGLDASRFERCVYHTAPVADAFTRRVEAGCERFAVLREAADGIAARLAADELDILVHPEVGMTAASYVLAAMRLAPVQLAGWGHPVTTGSDAIDGYLTCGAMEPEDGAQHYVERLLPLPGLGVQYAMPEPVMPYAREDLRLPARGALYACPQSLFKIHPRMDALFARLLARDPAATLLFFQAPSRGATERFAARLQAAMAREGLEPRRQVKFLPRLPGEGFRRVLATCDVVLDTLGWSGGNTTLDALSAGTPVATCEGRFMRGRQTAAMLGMLGLEELVAADEAGYLELAQSVARDGPRNAALRRAIAERRGALFDRPEPIRALEETLLRMAQGG